MTEEIKNEYSIRSAAIRHRELKYFIAADDDLKDTDVPHACVFALNKTRWEQVLIEKNLSSVCVAKIPKEQMVAVDEYGNVHVIGSGDSNPEYVSDGQNSPESRGPIREVRAIDGRAYAVGMDRQVYRRESLNVWKAIDGNINKKPASDDVFGFESIHGFSGNDMYTVGWHGEIWHFDGKKWTRIESPTNLILTRVYCAPTGIVYACGQSGILVAGKSNRWEIIEHDTTDQDLWDMEWYEGRLYLSTINQLFFLDNNILVPVDTGEEIPATCYHLDAADGILWSIGAKDVLEFDGKEWTRVL